MLKLGIELDTFAVLLGVELELVSFVLEVGVVLDALLLLLEVELKPVPFVLELGVASGVFAVLP